MYFEMPNKKSVSQTPHENTHVNRFRINAGTTTTLRVYYPLMRIPKLPLDRTLSHAAILTREISKTSQWIKNRTNDAMKCKLSG